MSDNQQIGLGIMAMAGVGLFVSGAFAAVIDKGQKGFARTSAIVIVNTISTLAWAYGVGMMHGN